MTVPRKKLVNVDVTRWYHCISRCVRQAHLLRDGESKLKDRKAWIEQRLQQLNEIFAISVGGFAILDNHLHVLVRIDGETAKQWTDEQVARRWLKLYPPRGVDRKAIPIQNQWLQEKLQDKQWIATIRQRLQSLGWFMKCLKEPLARMVNRSEKCTGAFFEGRYKSIAILDEEALVAVCAYIDLNPLAAGMSGTPENSPHTSIRQRVEHAQRQGRLSDLAQAKESSLAGSRAAAGLEDTLWLVPIEDRRRLDSRREGMLNGFTLGNYLLLVEHTGRLLRRGKASISAELESIFERLQSTPEIWQQRFAKLSRGRLFGRFFAGRSGRLRQAAADLGVRRVVNLTSCPIH